MSFALLFPGQGAQHPGMLPWLDDAPQARPVLDRMAALLGRDWRARLSAAEGPGWMARNEVAQPLLVGVSLAAWSVIAGDLGRPVAVAGYSVGELASYAAAGAFDLATAQDLAPLRAAAMERSAGALEGGMLAVSGLPAATVEALCTPLGLAVAIRIGPDRLLIGGADSALDEASMRLVQHGAECRRLAIHVASHTPQMLPAAAEFAAHLAAVEFAAPRCPVVTCFSGTAVRQPERLRRDLAAQIAHTVLWQQAMDAVAERRPACVLEVGPGTTLARLWAAAHPHIPVRSVDEFHDPRAIAGWLHAAAEG